MTGGSDTPMEGGEKEILTNSRFSQLPHGRESSQHKQDGGSIRLRRLVEGGVQRIEQPGDNALRKATIYAHCPTLVLTSGVFFENRPNRVPPNLADRNVEIPKTQKRTP